MPFDRCVLLPAADDAAVWVAELPQDLQRRYLVCSSSGKTLRALQDKSDFAEITTQLAIPVPLSFAVEEKEDLAGVPFDEIEALFLKPVDSQSFVSRYNKKAIWVENIEQATREWSRVNSDGLSLIAQEYVAGAASDHYFIDGFRDRDGIVRAKTARHRIRIYPADFGNSSYCRSVELDVVGSAWDGLDKLLLHMKYRGIFSAEFKRDARSHEFKILEVNTRPWVYVEFADVCGMNMCDLYIRDALGQKMSIVQNYASGKGCVDLYNDLIAVVEMPSEERPNILALIWTWFSAFKLLFAWRDPWPAMLFLARRIRARLRKVSQR